MASDNNPTATSPSSSAPHPPWIELPWDVTENILLRLGPMVMLAIAEKVCTTWRSVCGQPSLWRAIHMKTYDLIDMKHVNYEMLCRRAVDLSQGELIDISIQHFGTDDLLQHISHRSSNLKRLKLGLCHYVSPRGLTTTVKYFPLLEELELFLMPPIRAVDIETIGSSCPMLKSFIYHNRGYKYPVSDIDDSHAMSIAKSMPNLRNLCLYRNRLTNKGLEAILNGCPNLESLDLRKCFRVDLESDTGRRCSEKIKELRCPLDDEFYDDKDKLYNERTVLYSSDDDEVDEDSVEYVELLGAPKYFLYYHASLFATYVDRLVEDYNEFMRI